MKLTLEQQYILSVPHSQYHAWRCSGDFRSQSIIRYGIDPQSRNIPSLASEELQGIIWTNTDLSIILVIQGWNPSVNDLDY